MLSTMDRRLRKFCIAERQAAGRSPGSMPVTPASAMTSLLLFAIPTGMLYLATRPAMNWTNAIFPGPAILNWFFWGKVVFAALFAAALIALKVEQGTIAWRVLAERFRIRMPNLQDVSISLAVLIGCGLASGGIFLTWQGLTTVFPWLPAPNVTPPFVHMEPLTSGTLWLLIPWLVMFFFNIMGEELWWRGYLLPRQELQHGSGAPWVHALGLALFHLPLGIELTLILTPFLIGIPWVVSQRKNLCCGIIVHGLLNGLGFLAVAFGAA